MQRFWYTRLLTRVDDGMLDDLFSNVKEKEKAAIKQDREDEVLLEKIQQIEGKVDNTGGQGEWDETAQIMRQALQKEQEDGTVTNSCLVFLQILTTWVSTSSARLASSYCSRSYSGILYSNRVRRSSSSRALHAPSIVVRICCQSSVAMGRRSVIFVWMAALGALGAISISVFSIRKVRTTRSCYSRLEQAVLASTSPAPKT